MNFCCDCQSDGINDPDPNPDFVSENLFPLLNSYPSEVIKVQIFFKYNKIDLNF
jgi:hypothetical protein